MIEFTCSDFTFPLLSHRKALKLIALMDFSWVDIGLFANRSHLQPADQLDYPQKKGQKLLEITGDLGLNISDIFLQASLDFAEFAINHPDPNIRADQRELFKKTAEYTAACNCNHITGLPGVIYDQGSRSICENELAWRVEYANSIGITYAVEPHYGSIMESPETAIAILEVVEGLRITLDHSHYTAQGIDIEHIHPLVKYASHMHVRGAAKGEIQTPVAYNQTDFSAVAKHLKEADFSGTICIEYCYLDWENCNRTDNVSETLLLREHLMKLLCD